MHRSLGVVQVGAGAWGESWAAIVQRHPDWELAALVDLDEEARNSAATATGLAPELCFPKLGDALGAGVQADAALVVVPPPYHAPVAIEAIQAGLHCLIEKPLADTIGPAYDIVEAAEHAGLQAMVSQNYRFKRAPRTVRRLIKEGVIGGVEQVRIDFQKDPPFTGFRLEMEEPLITDMAVHHLDQIRGVAGLEPKVLRASSWNPSWSRFSGNACCLIEIETDEGAEVVYTGSWVSHGKHTTWDGAWDIQGDRGGLLWSENRVEIRFASLFDTVFMPGAFEREGTMEVELDELEFEERAGTLTEFAAAIREDRLAETHARDNLKSLALVLAAVESAKAGGKEIELEAFRDAQKV
jgi:predicted dehydrogenase